MNLAVKQLKQCWRSSVMLSVNWAEVVQKSLAAGVVVDGMREDLEALGLRITPSPKIIKLGKLF